MLPPSVDIIIPVWNNPFETRACLATILKCTPAARLIIVIHGSSRETELVLDDFVEFLGDEGRFIILERNIGLVPAINKGLASSDSDVAVIVRPHVQVGNGWLEGLLEAVRTEQTGIVSPLFTGSGAAKLPAPVRGCSQMETFSLSFDTLLLTREHRQIGWFDENLDGGVWCLRDYIRRADALGLRSCVTARTVLQCGQTTVYGSKERLQEQSCASEERYRARWGIQRHYCLYFGKEADAAELEKTVETICTAARHGNRFNLLLHRRQFKAFCQRGWHGLHTGIKLHPLSLFASKRSLARQWLQLQNLFPDIIAVCGRDNVLFPGCGTAIPFSAAFSALADNDAII